MALQMSFRKIRPTDALKMRVEKRMAKFHRLVTYTMDIDVRVSQEKMLHCVEITCHAEHRYMVAVAKTKDLYESIDLAAKKIEVQLKRERERHKGHDAATRSSRTKSLKMGQDVGAEIPHLEKKLGRI